MLRRAVLARVPAPSRPLLPDAPRPGIVHLGVGAFHRAHQAVYTELAMAEAGADDWGIVGVAPHSARTVTTLTGQDCLFGVTELDGDEARTRVVGSYAGVRHLPTQGPEIIALLADPAIRVVTLTVTEKAYLFDAVRGRLLDDPDLLADLAGRTPVRTIPGLLAAGLRARESAGGPPVALVSCDNLPGNGEVLQAVVTQALGYELPAWVSFPSTMVDRIVPATTPEVIERAAAALGVRDAAAVATEPYRAWVIRDDFPAGRPAWEAAGAVLTDDVTGYERLKLRVLNGLHSTVAYLGALAGCETVAEAIRLPGMEAYLRRLVADDIAPTLSPPPGVDIGDYAETVLHRFANAAIRYRTLQVASDGSQKLPQRLFVSLVERRASGALPQYLALAGAAWIRFTAGTRDDGRELPLNDPMATVLRRAAADGGSSAGRVRAIFALDAIVPPALAADDDLVALVTDQLDRLERDGAATTVASAVH